MNTPETPLLNYDQPNPEELEGEKKSLESQLAKIQPEIAKIEANPIIMRVAKEKARLANLLKSGANITGNQTLLDHLEYKYNDLTIADMLEFKDEILLAPGALTTQEIQRKFAESAHNNLTFKELQQRYGELVNERDQIINRLTEINPKLWPFETLTQETLQ